MDACVEGKGEMKVEISCFEEQIYEFVGKSGLSGVLRSRHGCLRTRIHIHPRLGADFKNIDCAIPKKFTSLRKIKDIKLAMSESSGSNIEAVTPSSTPSHESAYPRTHPLGPLSAQEIIDSANLVRGCWPSNVTLRFKVITLFEPAKAELAPYLIAERAGKKPSPIDRRALVVYYFKGTVSQVPNPLLKRH